ncbi:hypothetical protein X566_03300 [Afipia sp. P52-10]|nr:hypothetical protein X566_03300 [Afipia sp. P52-10]
MDSAWWRGMLRKIQSFRVDSLEAKLKTGLNWGRVFQGSKWYRAGGQATVGEGVVVWQC